MQQLILYILWQHRV